MQLNLILNAEVSTPTRPINELDVVFCPTAFLIGKKSPIQKAIRELLSQ